MSAPSCVRYVEGDAIARESERVGVLFFFKEAAMKLFGRRSLSSLVDLFFLPLPSLALFPLPSFPLLTLSPLSMLSN